MRFHERHFTETVSRVSAGTVIYRVGFVVLQHNSVTLYAETAVVCRPLVTNDGEMSRGGRGETKLGGLVCFLTLS